MRGFGNDALRPPIGSETGRAPERSQRWLVEFLVTGGLTPGVFLVLWALRKGLGLDDAEVLVGMVFFHAAHLINNPHFAVTYLLFYRGARERLRPSHWGTTQAIRYALSGFVVPIVLVVWLAAAFVDKSPELFGALIQLMFLLVGWHYVKQAFGVLIVLSKRRGYDFSPPLRRAALFHAYAAWAYAWASPAREAQLAEESGVIYTTLGIPPGLVVAAGALFFTSALVFALALASEVRTRRRLPPLGPLFGYLVSVWIWTVFTDLDPLLVYVIPALHSLQYLFFVQLLERGRGDARAFAPANSERFWGMLLASIALGWLLLRGGPEFFDGAYARLETARPLGMTPYYAAFFAFVNVHHYFMDHVIWRRENPDLKNLFPRRDPRPESF